MVEDVDSPEQAAELLRARAAWRAGAVVAAAVAAVLGAAGVLGPPVATLGVILAATIGVTAHLARQMRVEEWAARDDLAGLPELARARRRLVAAEHRREVAGLLRSIAAPRRASRHDVAPLLVGRLAPVRDELLEVAEEIERAPALHPGTIVELTRLMTDGVRSPLLNEAVPEGELAVLLQRIRFQLATARDDVRAAT